MSRTGHRDRIFRPVGETSGHARYALVIAAILFVSCRLLVADDPSPHSQVLKKHGVSADTDSLIAFLQELQPDPNTQKKITELVQDLSDASFAKREAATQQLIRFSEAARAQLHTALKSTSREVVVRARHILREMDTGTERDRVYAITLAVLESLKEQSPAEAVPVLLRTVEFGHQPDLQDAACEALWACIDKTHADSLNKAMQHANVRVQAAALIGLASMSDESARGRVKSFLSSDNEQLRLAAARALIDQSPQTVARVLLELLSSETLEVSAQSEAMLRAMTGKVIPTSERKQLADIWQKWSSQNLASTEFTRLGKHRLDLAFGRNSLDETFAVDMQDVTKGYRWFTYKDDIKAKADVVNGQLRLDGDHAEGDQRLVITSRRLTGRSTWPRHVEVRARLTGSEGGGGAWHMGISVGRIKAIFHPSYPGGGFRMETVDDHKYLTRNLNMSFTPRGAMHQLIMRVRRTHQGAEFDVRVMHGEDEGMFSQTFSYPNELIGSFDRIGLERSGRTGGAAVFESVSIRLHR